MLGIQEKELCNYDKHKNKVNETRRTKYKEDEEYRKKKQEQIQNYCDKVAFCNVCNSSMKAQSVIQDI